MTQDDIIKMAIEARLPHYWESGDEIVYIERVEHFAKLVAQHEQDQIFKRAQIAAELAIERAIELEREECLKICEEVSKYFPSSGFVGSYIGNKIRERGQA